MNRIDQKFKDLKSAKKKAFIAFVTAGDPNLKVTEELVLAFEKKGADIIELGVPFSDPLADGPTIQASSQRALKHGVNLTKILHTVGQIRKRSNIPIALMTYYNPVFCYGESQFMRDAKKYGVDGVIIPDLPHEEGKGIIQLSKKYKLATIFFVTPTTTPARMKQIIKVATGFIYYVSLTGVTGVNKKSLKGKMDIITAIKKITNKPVCVGFGVSTATQVRSLAKVADGVIVGSAIVNQILHNKGKKNLVKNVSNFVWTLSKGLNS